MGLDHVDYGLGLSECDLGLIELDLASLAS
jgi:hypothetical protein